MPKEQSAKSHGAFDPMFHYFLAPLFLANLIVAIVLTVKAWPHDRFVYLWGVAMAIGLFALVGMTRAYSLADQDRIIRLEERLRIAALVPAADVYKLSTKQLIALRFASDAELPALVYKTLAENLGQKTIKQSIITWRPDHHRI